MAGCLFLSSPAAVLGGGDASCHLLGKCCPRQLSVCTGPGIPFAGCLAPLKSGFLMTSAFPFSQLWLARKGPGQGRVATLVEGVRPRV